MDFILPKMRHEEIVALKLRGLFEKSGYSLFRMGSFEEYDLYLQNRSFLTSDDIISFSGADGKLMALKPDVTLSIVKNTPANTMRKIYYNENVYRRSRQSGEYRQINQMGLEYIGGTGIDAELEVLNLAVASLGTVGRSALDLSHMELISAMLAPFEEGLSKQDALQALRDKSPHNMRQAAMSAGLETEYCEKLASFSELSGPFDSCMKKARVLSEGISSAQKALDELDVLYSKLDKTTDGCGSVDIRLDFSILNDADYYNGIMFQGFVQGVPRPVLAGGRYDNLLHRFEKPQGAIGFALYLDAVGNAIKSNGQAEGTDGASANNYLNIALPKGRLGNKVYSLFEKAGFGCQGLLDESRKLVFEDDVNKVRYFLVKPGDVDIYVERGAADIGVVGRDVLLENGSDVLELIDLKLGKCRLAVAGKADFQPSTTKPIKVATKYPNVTRWYYAQRSQSVEIIKLHGSIELAPLLKLSDVIVDIVETGSTLVENGLSVLADVAPSSARLIANRASWRFKEEIIRNLAQKLGEMI